MERNEGLEKYNNAQQEAAIESKRKEIERQKAEEYNTWTTVRVYSAWCGAVTKISSSSLISYILRDPILWFCIVVRVIIVVTIATIA